MTFDSYSIKHYWGSFQGYDLAQPNIKCSNTKYKNKFKISTTKDSPIIIYWQNITQYKSY